MTKCIPHSVGTVLVYHDDDSEDADHEEAGEREDGTDNLFRLPTFIVLPVALIAIGCKIRKTKDAFYLKRV